MGARSSSSNQTTSNNNSGQNAISGDNLGTAISGVSGSTINVEATDHGAVNAALELGGELLDTNGQVVKDSLNAANDAFRESTRLSEKALKESLGSVNTSLRMVENNSRDSLTFAGRALEEYGETNSENLQVMAGLSGSQAKQNADSLNKIMELAKFNKDGGQNESFKYQIILLGVVIVVMAIVAMAASNNK